MFPEVVDSEVNGVRGRNFPNVQDRCESKAGCCQCRSMSSLKQCVELLVTYKKTRDAAVMRPRGRSVGCICAM